VGKKTGTASYKQVILPAAKGLSTLLAVSTDIETEQITNGNLTLKGNCSVHDLQ
jgi:hypothetical protein